MRVFLALLGGVLTAAGAGVALCDCGEARSHGWWPGWDASARVSAEASVGTPVGFGDVDAGCTDCPRLADAGACPPTWAEASAWDALAVGCPAAECGYPGGTCVCLLGCGGGQIHAFGASWFCTPVTPECPSPRPQPGTPCGDSGAHCEYGSPCCFGSWTMDCTGGVWDGFQGSVCP